MLHIENLHVSVQDKPILKGVNLTIESGTVHAIMGPNGSGKSTLSYVLAGHEGYAITQGEILFQGKPVHELKPYERARLGIFLAMQYPVEIPGVSNVSFLKTMVNIQRKAAGLTEVDALDFLTQVKSLIAQVGLPESFLYRHLNEGFSGGEKKRNELLQMLLLKPAFCILDEIDSGLDIDALKTVSAGVNALRGPERSVLMITHYQRLLDYITPDYIHVFADGKIVHSGDKELALTLEEKGYGWIEVVEDKQVSVC